MADNPELVPRRPAGLDRPQQPAPGTRTAENSSPLKRTKPFWVPSQR